MFKILIALALLAIIFGPAVVTAMHHFHSRDTEL